jgi:hypothetical protein
MIPTRSHRKSPQLEKVQNRRMHTTFSQLTNNHTHHRPARHTSRPAHHFETVCGEKMKLTELENLFVTKLSEKHQLTKRELKKVFHKYDLDGSGYLTTSELCQAIGSFINGVDPTLIQELVRQYDVDQDGTINLDEFCHFILSRNSSNPSEWMTVNHLTSTTSTAASPQTHLSSTTSRVNRSEEMNFSSTSSSNKNQLKKIQEEENLNRRGIEQQAKLFLQGMKSMLMKNILEDRGLGRISTKDRLTQKTSQLVATQSKIILQQLFAPYEASANSSGIPFHGFKR